MIRQCHTRMLRQDPQLFSIPRQATGSGRLPSLGRARQHAVLLRDSSQVPSRQPLLRIAADIPMSRQRTLILAHRQTPSITERLADARVSARVDRADGREDEETDLVLVDHGRCELLKVV